MLLGHRYYDQSTGRFLSEDPARDGANWYAYCENNPLGAVDPEGLELRWGHHTEEGKKEFQVRVKAAFASLAKTASETAKIIADAADDKQRVYVIHHTRSRNEDGSGIPRSTIGDGTQTVLHIWLDPDAKIKVETTDKANPMQEVPFEIQVIHEFGHANGKLGGKGYGDPGGGQAGAPATPDDVVGAIENAARTERKEPLRTKY